MPSTALVLCTLVLPVAVAQTDDATPVWEIAFAAGAGTLALLLCAYAVYTCRRAPADVIMYVDADASVDAPADAPGVDAMVARACARARNPARFAAFVAQGYPTNVTSGWLLLAPGRVTVSSNRCASSGSSSSHCTVSVRSA